MFNRTGFGRPAICTTMEMSTMTPVPWPGTTLIGEPRKLAAFVEISHGVYNEAKRMNQFAARELPKRVVCKGG